MRFWLACLFCVGAWPEFGFAQVPRIDVEPFIPHQSFPSYGGGYGGGRQYGPYPAGYGYGGYYGPSYGGGYYGRSPFGLGYSSYSSVSYGVPGFSVGYAAPLFGNTYYGGGYGYSGWGAPIYTTSSPVYNVFPQTPLPALPQWMLDEANAANQPVERVKPLSQTHRSLIQPSTPEAQLRSVRLQDAGDRLFANLDYSAAEKSYAKSIQAAPDRPDPYVRLSLAKAARGDFRTAVAFLKQVSEVDASYPRRADSLDRLFDHQNGISKLQFKQNVADWTKVDVRDSDRLFLLGVVLFLDGDERFRTLLDTAVALEGNKPYLQVFLEATPVQNPAKPAPTPDEIDALTQPAPAAPQPNLPNAPLVIPTLPDPPTP